MHDVPVRLGLPVRARFALRRLWRAACTSLAVTFLGVASPSGPAAQETQAPVISIAPAIVAGANTEAVLPIEIAPHAAIPEGSFVSLRGLPPTVGLRRGHAVGPGWWAVPLAALPSLEVDIPAGLSGESGIVVSLIARDGRLLAQARSALVIQPRPHAGQVPAASVAPAPAPAPAELSDEQRARAERLLARGEAYLANGNIIAARDFFERGADSGLAASALRLAATYDPVVLKRLQVQGVAPDLGLARKWYQRAHDLGSAEAAASLRRLAGN
jgi:hypothetical protein